MRLRTTAPPSAFLMLNPKRLSGSWFARKKTVKWEFERRLPVRYTASNSPRRTNRASRGNSRPSGLFGSEPMASLFAARRQHLAASHSLHAYAKSVRLRAPPFSRLICSLWQSNPPLGPNSKLRSARTRCFSQPAMARSGRSLDRSTDPKHTATTSRPSSRFRISKCSRP
jgi:hypothetical protein